VAFGKVVAVVAFEMCGEVCLCLPVVRVVSAATVVRFRPSLVLNRCDLQPVLTSRKLVNHILTTLLMFILR
jgi:branched-subunit amino acid ABC-type transport system permease component